MFSNLLLSNMADVAAEIMEKNNLKSEDIAWLVPHQANLRIIDATGRRMGLAPEKVMINIENYGNTTTATIPLCFWEYEKRLKKGDNSDSCCIRRRIYLGINIPEMGIRSEINCLREISCRPPKGD